VFFLYITKVPCLLSFVFFVALLLSLSQDFSFLEYLVARRSSYPVTSIKA